MNNTVKGFQTNEGTKQYDYNALANLPTLISQDDVNGVVANALEQAKKNGDFKGEPGDDYILTEADKVEIAEMAADLVDIPDSSGKVDFVVQDTPPEDTSVLWINTGYEGEEEQPGSSADIQEAVNKALQQAKDKGDFKGEPGDDYILTEDDKREVANIVLTMLPTWNGGSY